MHKLTLSRPSCRMLHLGMLTLLLPFTRMLYELWQDRALPSNLLIHTYLPILEHLLMSVTLWLCGVLLLDLMVKQLKNDR